MSNDFQVGDKVHLISGKSAGVTGEISQVDTMYKEFNYGNFEPNGLVILESTLTSFCVPYELNENVLTVFTDETKSEFTEYHYFDKAFVVALENYQVVVSRKSLVKVA